MAIKLLKLRYSFLLITLFFSCETSYEIDPKVMELFMDDIPANHLTIYLNPDEKGYLFGTPPKETLEEYGISLIHGKKSFDKNWLKSFFEGKGYKVVFKSINLRDRSQHTMLSETKHMYIDFSQIYCNDKTSKCLLLGRFVCGRLCAMGYDFILERKGNKMILVDWSAEIS
ncbi:MAG TPA: hypothetical protein PKC40_06905 [Saprospiraceae bacterium]|nr:hypothetical protein [Saprospiraceae bacterium]